MTLGLALLAAATARWCRRRPAVAASLWARVLLKLVAPPIWGVDVGWGARDLAVGATTPSDHRAEPIPAPIVSLESFDLGGTAFAGEAVENPEMQFDPALPDEA